MIHNIQNENNQPQLGDQTQVSGMQGAELSQEEMRANLQNMAGKIDESYQDFNSKKFASDNRMNSKKRDALKEVFNMMLEEGVDLENPESVRSFLDSLKETNEELYQIVENSLEKVFSITDEVSEEESLGQADMEEIIPQPTEQNDMNMDNENLPTNI